ncbi:hypothetical protein Dimus_008602 [Dionaea muscipula]
MTSKIDLALVAVGLAILNANELRLKDKILNVKRAAYGRGASGQGRSGDVVVRLRMEPSCGRDQQEEWSGRAPRFQEGLSDVSMSDHSHVGGFSYLAYKEELQKLGEKTVNGFVRSSCLVFPPIVITSKSHGVKRLQRSCVIDWSPGSGVGTDASSLLSDFGG